MKVGNLIEKLSTLDPHSDVYLSRDAEGNEYSFLGTVDTECIVIDGDIYSTSWSAEDACMEESEWQREKSRKKCVVLYPGYK